MAPIFPAIALAGPPHSGKSTLTYWLSQALRSAHVMHYVLRASPDGEGDWSYEAESDLVRVLRSRVRGEWTAEFANQVSHAVAHRHLPLLVDLGGKPSKEVLQIARQCTHAILISADPARFEDWHRLFEQADLQVIAQLHSVQQAEEYISDATACLMGTIADLKRELPPDGPMFRELLKRIGQIFSYTSQELYDVHRQLAPSDYVLNVQAPLPPVHQRPGERWEPAQLVPLLKSLPTDELLCVYGRGPVWLYGALAGLTPNLPFFQFDARYGWLASLEAVFAERPREPLRWSVAPYEQLHAHVKFDISGSLLDYTEAAPLHLPALPLESGVLLDGKLPNWLFTSLVRAYYQHAWVAVYQVQIGFVVVASRSTGMPIGSVLPAPKSEI